MSVHIEKNGDIDILRSIRKLDFHDNEGVKLNMLLKKENTNLFYEPLSLEEAQELKIQNDEKALAEIRKNIEKIKQGKLIIIKDELFIRGYPNSILYVNEYFNYLKRNIKAKITTEFDYFLENIVTTYLNGRITREKKNLVTIYYNVIAGYINSNIDIESIKKVVSLSGSDINDILEMGKETKETQEDIFKNIINDIINGKSRIEIIKNYGVRKFDAAYRRIKNWDNEYSKTKILTKLNENNEVFGEKCNEAINIINKYAMSDYAVSFEAIDYYTLCDLPLDYLAYYLNSFTAKHFNDKDAPVIRNKRRIIDFCKKNKHLKSDIPENYEELEQKIKKNNTLLEFDEKDLRRVVNKLTYYNIPLYYQYIQVALERNKNFIPILAYEDVKNKNEEILKIKL